MKPALGMELGKTDSVTVMGMNTASEKAPKACSSKRVIVGVITGVIALAAVSAIVLVSVHLGSEITKDSLKVVHQTFKSDKGEVIEEETSVSKTEVDVRIPNVAEVIYDYKHGIVVTRFVDRESNTQSECLAQYMNETEAPSTDPNEYSSGEVDMYHDDADEDREAEQQEWVRTDKLVPHYLISEKVERMCGGTEIFWMKKVTQQRKGVEKRQTCTSYYRIIICKRLIYPCAYRCLLKFYCVPTYRLVLIRYANACKRGCNPGPSNPICPLRNK